MSIAPGARPIDKLLNDAGFGLMSTDLFHREDCAQQQPNVTQGAIQFRGELEA
jgi:hypothetical protein